jgi:hypothetical protein
VLCGADLCACSVILIVPCLMICEHKHAYNDLVCASASDSVVMKSAVSDLVSGATSQWLQQHASEEGIRTQDHMKRSSAQTVTLKEPKQCWLNPSS